MSARAIREFDGKRLVGAHIGSLLAGSVEPVRVAQVKVQLTTPGITPAAVATLDPATPLSDSTLEPGMLSPAEVRQQLEKTLVRVEQENPWLMSTPLVVKPDQLIKRRGKAGLLLLNADWKKACEWMLTKAGDHIEADGVSGSLKNFIIEPFVPHAGLDEYYVCIQSTKNGDEIMFCAEGGVDVGNVDAKAKRLEVPIDTVPSIEQIEEMVKQTTLPKTKTLIVSSFILNLFKTFANLHFTYLEINPLVVVDEKVFIMDMAAKLDQTAEYECSKKWNVNGVAVEFPAPFGREMTPEEAYVAELDSKTGASLKLTILNKDGRIWTMVAGGGASVAYSDAIAGMGMAHELANYGEYSGAPSETQTYEYSKTILDLMTRGTLHPLGKILFIGGGIANFTNVATTFQGIIRALQEYRHRLIQHGISIYVRRGGPNYQEGLKMMRELGDVLGVPIHVFGPDTHITAIVPMALKPDNCVHTPPADAVGLKGEFNIIDQLIIQPNSNSNGNGSRSSSPIKRTCSAVSTLESTASAEPRGEYQLFDKDTRSFVFGMQQRAVQGMLDFDYICKRKTPSVAALIYPFGGDHVMKFYWGTKEILVPVYSKMGEACERHPDVDVVVNFASCRSVPESCFEIIEKCAQIKTIAIIAEGVPERHTKRINERAKRANVSIIGPATVGGLRAGAFKIGNTGGMIDNIISSRLHRPGSVCYVSKSGGMSNELNNIIARTTNGVLEGVAIGGDRYPGSTFLDHIKRFEEDARCKMIVLLGEVGGTEEYSLCEAIKSGQVTKPVIAWCIGVQFGHAGACANSDRETATSKNLALKESGAVVPDSFELLPSAIEETYLALVKQGVIVPEPEPEMPKVPIDYAWAQELGLIRKPAQFVSTICDDRGQELLYAGMPISAVFKDEIGIGGVLSLLWFRRRLPDYACKFIEMVLMLTADHGPAVSGAHNTIVAARAGKDLVSSLASGLLTIGERFGGALDGAAEQFTAAYDQGLTPNDFVETMRKQHKLIMGIGHRIKSRTNPDLRVTILKDFAKKNFPTTPLLEYALQVENLTTAKKDNLILNVDGATAVLFVDLLRNSGAFTRAEADEYVRIGAMNGLFVLGRSIGFIGHYLDQKRLKQGLYRHPWDDISYLNPNLPDQPRYEN
ncbi:putative ATP-citrate synthase subunit 1 (ATP-citrate (Pro-S-)-lyase 1) [Paramicrosporidium saccamoebae]|uniref:ATP-citrate synthase n=1 Tax=Paramicrosporidium saccamoebae TaxID=1246581 RepID=A0A2H9TPA8_9FUNG|nr:putative ATP-citrate synthase subunit 1 (ATP-citrate (Pro-S-)-lyase 1) [Paramicrosporidium saccamoebae]